MRTFAVMAKPAAEGMTDTEKFYFDLNGYIIVRGALSAEEVAACHKAIDSHSGEILERKETALRNTKAGTPLSGDGATGRRDLGGMLGWPKPHCDPFRALLAHKKLTPYLNELCGRGYRMDHLPLVLMQNKGAEGFELHGGPLNGQGRFNPTLQYRCTNGDFYNSLVAMSVVLTEHKAGDGGFCVVRGSHKMNFPLPDTLKHGIEGCEHLYQPVTQPGDVIFFSEATVHGCLPWNADHERRIALYRFAPACVAYGRSYSPQWPEEMLKDLGPRERAVLEPPYAERLDRPILKDGESEPEVQSRSAAKRKFDKLTHGTAYF